jgi:hypothetical protein
VCRSKHVEPPINFGTINSITKLHFVGISIEWVIIRLAFNLSRDYTESIETVWFLEKLNSDPMMANIDAETCS